MKNARLTSENKHEQLAETMKRQQGKTVRTTRKVRQNIEKVKATNLNKTRSFSQHNDK